jgi:hypothetical protein
VADQPAQPAQQEPPAPAEPEAAIYAVPEEVTGEMVTADQAEQFKPPAHQLVVTDPSDEQQVFVVLDRHDEQQIIEEFQRRALRVMLYDFSQGSKQLVDLSYQGVNEGVRLMNATGKCRIRIQPGTLSVEEVTEDAGNGPERFYVATVYAEDEVTGYGQYGTSTEPVLMRMKGGKTKWDVFARTKAINKAQRNALKVMIPEGMRQTLIAQYLGNDAAVRQIQAGPGAEALAELPAPLTDDRAREQNARIKALWLEILEHAPGGVAIRVTPAYFHAMWQRSHHDHDQLDAFIGYLEQRLSEAIALAEKTGGGS